MVKLTIHTGRKILINEEATNYYKPPTSKEMREFAKKFTKFEWERLSEQPQFLAAFTVDLVKAEIFSNKLFGRKNNINKRRVLPVV